MYTHLEFMYFIFIITIIYLSYYLHSHHTLHQHTLFTCKNTFKNTCNNTHKIFFSIRLLKIHVLILVFHVESDSTVKIELAHQESLQKSIFQNLACKIMPTWFPPGILIKSPNRASSSVKHSKNYIS